MSTAVETNPALETILLLVMELTKEDRIKLVNRLKEINDEETLTPEEWETGWAEECDRRIADMRSGRRPGVPAEEVLRLLGEKYG